MSDSWFFRQRQEWIAEMVRVYGFVNREHLEKKFEISTPQASTDLAYFQKENPSILEYNKSTKRYEDAERNRSDRACREAYNALLEDLNDLCSEFGCLGGEHRLNWLRSQLKQSRDAESAPKLALTQSPR